MQLLIMLEEQVFLMSCQLLCQLFAIRGDVQVKSFFSRSALTTIFTKGVIEFLPKVSKSKQHTPALKKERTRSFFLCFAFHQPLKKGDENTCNQTHVRERIYLKYQTNGKTSESSQAAGKIYNSEALIYQKGEQNCFS